MEALADPAVRSRLAALGMEIFPRDQQRPETFGTRVKGGAEKWWPLIREFGIKQAKLRVFIAGDGPSIVMLPARGVGPFELEPVAERLMAADFRVILPEPRGYGESIGGKRTAGLGRRCHCRVRARVTRR